jgi:hypothetical protein
VPRRGPPSPAGPRRGESVRDWYFGLDGPARYRVLIKDEDVAGAITAWAMSPGEAIDAAIVYVDATEKINVGAAPAQVEEIARLPEPDDIKATDEGWPFAPPPRRLLFDRHDAADAVIFVALLGIVGAVVGLFAFTLFSVLNGDWVPAAITASIASFAGAALAALWLKS